MLGDCVDRGPDSRDVIDELLALRERCRLVPLLGNHEEMMLNFLDGRPQPDNWLLCGGAADVDSYTRCRRKNAGIPRRACRFHPHVGRLLRNGVPTSSSTAAIIPISRLAEQRWQTWRWHSLRSRFPEPHVSGKIAVVGHTSHKDGEILDLGHLVCIDTYCWGGGWLTALDTTTGQMWQADREGRIRE